MKGNFIMKKSLAFTLAEVLITLAIIGVVAAMTIPSVIVNTNQQEFKTGLRKAISVLNSSITMNVALEGETPYDNENLFEYLQQHMSVISSTAKVKWDASNSSVGGPNAAFYTTDGMRFEIPTQTIQKKLHENDTDMVFNSGDGSHSWQVTIDEVQSGQSKTGRCGTNGLVADSDTNFHPCLILVDVNGDRKPTPSNANSTSGENYIYPAVTDKLLKDIFPVIITDQKAIPYGVIAQKAMYQAKN